MLQCVAECCRVLQCVVVGADSWEFWQCVRVYVCVCAMERVCCSVLQCVAVCCSGLQCVAICCNVL